MGDFWRRLARNRLLDVGAVMVTLLVVFRWVSVLPSRWSDYDFNHYYVGSRTLLAGQNPYTTSLKTMSQALGFTFSEKLPIAGYLPSFLWMLMPLDALPPRAAFAIWVLGGDRLPDSHTVVDAPIAGREIVGAGLAVAALTINSKSASYHLLFSQVQLLLAALVLAGYAAHRTGRHGWGCLAVSAAGILKFYPFISLP